jgi:hypothetical protein
MAPQSSQGFCTPVSRDKITLDDVQQDFKSLSRWLILMLQKITDKYC